jgi:hypothetical protein
MVNFLHKMHYNGQIFAQNALEWSKMHKKRKNTHNLHTNASKYSKNHLNSPKTPPKSPKITSKSPKNTQNRLKITQKSLYFTNKISGFGRLRGRNFRIRQRRLGNYGNWVCASVKLPRQCQVATASAPVTASASVKL